MLVRFAQHPSLFCARARPRAHLRPRARAPPYPLSACARALEGAARHLRLPCARTRERTASAQAQTLVRAAGVRLAVV